MDIRLIGITLTLTVIRQSFSLPLGCSYNGTFHKEGDSIKAKDPCLSCSCRSGALVCNLRVCATPPNPLPKNCFIVHKDNECCPHMLCEENYNDNGIELRTAFKPKKTMERNDCMVNGTAFAEGSAVGSPHLCEYCYCLKGEIKCLKPRCSQNFKDCKPIYHESFCCPTHYDCRISDDSKPTTKLNNHGCKRNGTLFLDGDMVPFVNNSRCESCYCMKGEIVCTPITCQIEQDLKNCQPLNTQDQCCPTAFDCEKPQLNDYINTSSDFSNVEESSKVELETAKPSTPASAGESEPDVGLTTTESQLQLETSTAELEMESTKDFITAEIEKYETNLNLSAPTDVRSDNGEKVDAAKNTTVARQSSEPTSPLPQTTLNVQQEKILSRNSEKLDVKNRAEESETDLLYGEILRNSSSSSDDYDTYDYSEPKLPPSLPNLVIFPFVAADAVVKDKTETGAYVLEPNNIKKIDGSPGYYGNFYSPHIQQGVGFSPKDNLYYSSQLHGYYDNRKTSKLPSISGTKGEVFSGTQDFLPSKNGNCFWDGKEIWHGEALPETEECLSCVCQHGEIICREIACQSLEPGCVKISVENSCCGKIICDLGSSENMPTHNSSVSENKKPIKLPDPFEEVIKTEMAPDLSQFSIIPDTTLNPFTLKPVTVTYKNIILDYYPKFSVASSRDNINLTIHENLLAESDTSSNISPVDKFYASAEVNTTPEKMSTDFTMSTISITTTAKPSFLSELFMSWLGEDVELTTAVPTAGTKVKHTSQTNAELGTAKQSFTNEVATEKIQELDSDSNANFSDHSLIQKKYSVHNESTFESSQKTPRPLKIDPAPFKNEHQQLSNSENKEDSKKNKKNQENTHKKTVQAEGSDNNFTTFLKLAGCNIYGRMYRVGKIIAELSGPCLECVCTNSGVQCNSLPC